MPILQLQQPPIAPVANLMPKVWAGCISLMAISVWTCMVLLPYVALPTTAVASVKTVCAQSKGCVSATPTMFGSDSSLSKPRMGFIVTFSGNAADQAAMLKAMSAVVDTSAITFKAQAASASAKVSAANKQ